MIDAIGLRVNRLSSTEIGLSWPWLMQLIGPAIAMDKGRSLMDVWTKLQSGEMGMATIHTHNGAGIVTLEPGEFDGVWALWVPYIFAKVKAGPKAFVQTIRAVMGRVENVAREANLVEVRIGGRDWGPILPDYERFNDTPNMLRKVL